MKYTIASQNIEFDYSWSGLSAQTVVKCSLQDFCIAQHCIIQVFLFFPQYILLLYLYILLTQQ